MAADKAEATAVAPQSVMTVQVFGLDCLTYRDLERLCSCQLGVPAFLDASITPGFILFIDPEYVCLADDYPTRQYSKKFLGHLRAWQLAGYRWVRLCSNHTVGHQPYSTDKLGRPFMRMKAHMTLTKPIIIKCSTTPNK